MSLSRGRGSPCLKGSPRFFPRSDEAGIEEAGNGVAEFSAGCTPVQEPSVNECFVCCRQIKVFAVGACDHPVCHVCSTRLRVLCEKNECPGCRAIVEEVFFVTKNSSFENIKKMQFSCKVEKFGISFENDEIFADYNELLTNKCNECVRRAVISERSGERSHPPECYENFEALREHVQRDHKRYFCDLCVENLALFTFERQVYSKSDLRRHLKEGDLNDKSHRGHPRCDFCKTHYLDKDELYKHLKIDHFPCFICQKGNAGKRLLQYYASYDDLRQHFMRDHFLCEEGECAMKRFVAFDTKLEHKAHIATNHSESLSREEQRAARDLGADFAIPSSARESYRGDGESAPIRRGNRENLRSRYGSARERARHSPEPEIVQDELFTTRTPSVDTTSTKDFPSLLGDSSISRPLIPTPQYGNRMATLMSSADEFPSLGRPTDPVPSSSITWFKPIRNGAMSSATRSTMKSTPSVSAQTTSKPVNQAKPGIDLFPTLPQSDFESDFGKVLKPIPTRKQQKGGQITAPEEKRSLVGPNFSVHTNTSAKDNGQNSNTDFKVVTKGSTNAQQRARSTGSCVNNLPGSFSQLNTKNCFEPLHEFNSKSSTASWAVNSTSTHDGQRTPNDKKSHSARPKLPKAEDFPSLGATCAAVSSANLRPVRSTYRGIKPGELGQGSRSHNQFIQPPSFNKRTTGFMGMLKLLLNGDSERVTEYRLSLTNFRKGIISGEEFVYNCMQLFDDCSEFTKVFVELVCLIPDIEKQNELIRLYDNLKSEYGPQRKGSTRDWLRCSECGQITIPEDTQSHQKAH